MINEERAKEFQILYYRETGEKISLEEAFKCAESLVEIVKILLRPINRKKFEELRKHNFNVII